MNPLRIAEPCHESCEAMTPDVRGRHCAVCAKTVIDVTAMAPAERRAFIADELPARLARGERVCVRAHADARGRLLRPGARRYLLTNGLAALLAVSMAGCGDEPPTQPRVVMGRYALPPQVGQTPAGRRIPPCACGTDPRRAGDRTTPGIPATDDRRHPVLAPAGATAPKPHHGQRACARHG